MKGNYAWQHCDFEWHVEKVTVLVFGWIWLFMHIHIKIQSSRGHYLESCSYTNSENWCTKYISINLIHSNLGEMHDIALSRVLRRAVFFDSSLVGTVMTDAITTIKSSKFLHMSAINVLSVHRLLYMLNI